MLLRIALVMLLLATVNAAVAEEPASEHVGEPEACTHSLTVWQWTGGSGDGDEWTARVLEMHRRQARMQELVIRFEVPRFSDTERRWFAFFPLDPILVSALVGEHVFVDDEWNEICEALREAGLDSLVSRALGPTTLGGPRLGTVESTTEWREGKAGFKLRPVIEPRGDDEKLSSGAPRPPETAMTPSRRLSQAPQLSSLAGAVESIAQDLEVGPADPWDGVLVASTLRGALLKYDEGLWWLTRSDFETVASHGELAAALAVIGTRGPQNLGALVFLGDEPWPRAVFDLSAALRQGVEEDSEAAVGLSLRALVKASPGMARREAVELLGGPHTRPALGVFYFTEPALLHKLDDLDLEDEQAVAEEARRVLEYVAASDEGTVGEAALAALERER